MGARRAGLAAARRDRPLPGRAVGDHPGATPRPRSYRRGGRPAARPTLLRRSAPGRALRVVRRSAAVARRRLVRRPRHRRRRPPPRRRPRLATGAVAATGRAGRRTLAAGAPARHRRTSHRGPGGLRPAARGLAVRPYARVGQRGRAAGRPGDRPRRPPLAAASVADLVAIAGGRHRHRRPIGRRQPPAGTAPLAGEPRPRHPRAPAGAVGRRTGHRRRGAAPARGPHDAARVAPGRPPYRCAVPRGARRTPGRPLGPGPRLPRSGPAGRRPARGAARPAGRRPDPRATRRPRDVSGHRDLRTADRGGLRPHRRGAATRDTPPIGCGSVSPTGRRVRPTRCLAVARSLLDIAGGRAPATRVLDLARAEPVRRRFGFSDDDLDQLDTWVRESGVRWAFDAEHRQDFGLSDYVANTWEFGLDRLLTGVALSDDSSAWLDRALPMDDVGSAQVDLVGRLTEYVDRLRDATDRLRGREPLDDWLDALGEGIECLTSVSSADGWQAGQVQRELGRVRHAAAGLGALDLRLPDVRALLSDRLAGRPTRANFRTGTLTVCTMVPMRSVPHRVVCLLGLDDGVFPRQGSVDGDDVLARRPPHRRARRPQRGPPAAARRDPRRDRDAGGDLHRRQRVLRAAATTRRTPGRGARRPRRHGRHRRRPAGVGGRHDPPPAPAVRSPQPGPRGARGRPGVLLRRRRGLGRSGRARTTGRTDAVRRGRRCPRGRPPMSPSPTWCASGATRSRGSWAETASTSPWRRTRSSRRTPCRWRSTTSRSGPWATGSCATCSPAVDPEVVKQREWRRGLLPPGRLGWRMLDDIVTKALPLRDAGLERRTAEPRSVDVSVDLGDGRGCAAPCPRCTATGWWRCTTPGWVPSTASLLALAARARGVRRRPQLDRPHASAAPPQPLARRTARLAARAARPRGARTVLRDLVALRDAGLREPLPLPLKTSLRYARARRARADVPDALEKAGYELADASSAASEDGDAATPDLGRGRTAAARVSAAPAPGEEFAGETSRFGALALRVWSPADRRPSRGAGDGVVRHHRPAADRHHAARGQRRHRQDLHRRPPSSTRYVAEGHATLDQLLVITFGRAASQELRERVRDQLVLAERALADPAAADRAHPVIDTLLRGDDAELASRRRRGYATRSRRSTPPRSRRPTSSARSCCAPSAWPATPTPARRWSSPSTSSWSRWSTTSTCDAFGRLARHRRSAGRGAGTGPHRRRRRPRDARRRGRRRTLRRRRAGRASPEEVRDEVERRKRRLGILSYDDLLGLLADALADADAPARATDAPALEDRARRRVPGHRPDAVAGPRPGVHRSRDDGPDR